MKKLLLVLFGMVPFLSFSQQIEIEEITHTVGLYFDGMVHRDRSKLDEAFHPEAKLIGYRGDNFTLTPYETWAGGTACRHFS